MSHVSILFLVLQSTETLCAIHETLPSTFLGLFSSLSFRALRLCVLYMRHYLVPFWDSSLPCPSEHWDFMCYTWDTMLVPFWDFSLPCPSEHWDFDFFSWLEFSWALVEGPLWYQTHHHHNHLQCHHQWELW